ncbi:hypothetical protein Gpo141_00005508 [Globisporangium polare]
MAFGFGRRADKSSSKSVEGGKNMPQQQAQQQQQQVDTNNNSHNRIDAQLAQAPAATHAQAAHSRQHIRLDGDSHNSAPHTHHRHERSATITTSNSHIHFDPRRRGGELAGSLLETRSQPQVRPTRGMTTAASAFLDEHAQQFQQQHDRDQQLRRMRRGTATTSQYSTSAKSTTSSADSADRPDANTKVDILFKGHLMIKRGLLKGLEKRFYFLVRNSPELYCCKDETSFNLWFASGWSLNAGSEIAKGSGLTPVLVCSVLRADRVGDSGGSDRGIVLVAAASSVKSASFKFYAESTERCERWIKAFHKVQASKRSAADNNGEDADPVGANGPLVSPHSSTAASSSGGSSGHREPHHSHNAINQDFVASPRHVLNHIRTRQASRSDASQGSSASGNGTNGAPRAYASGQLRTKSREDAQSVKSSSSSSDHSEAPSTARSEQRPPGLFNSALSSQGSQGNVLLFVPAAGSTISVSDSKLALAKKQIQELLAQGAKRPTRGGMDAPSQQQQHPNLPNPSHQSPNQWRYGPPEYVLADLEYMKHKLREHESTPLESYVEECCQTFLMEATHRAHYSDWSSVRQEYFYLQVNDGERIPGHVIRENDMFGLLFVNNFEVTTCDVDAREGEEKDPRAILSEAFTEGFPMEVLEVYTQPPQCYFSWRHWGPFSGHYKGVKGDGSRVEIRGFGQMQIDSNRMLNLRLFFKTKDLFDALSKVATTLGQQRARDAATQRSRAVSSATPHFPVASTSAPASSSSASAPTSSSSSAATAAAQPAVAAAPPVAPKSKAMLTADIMDELANFTIAAKERSK